MVKNKKQKKTISVDTNIWDVLSRKKIALAWKLKKGVRCDMDLVLLHILCDNNNGECCTKYHSNCYSGCPQKELILKKDNSE